MSESDKKGRKRTPSFRIEISGNDDKKHDILETLASVHLEGRYGEDDQEKM
jgi:hypothetical protein